MDMEASGSPKEGWSLYADPRIFRVAAGTPKDGWILVTLEIDPEEERGIGICGTRLLSQENPGGAEEMAGLSLQLKLEEIPRLIAILNEVYRQHHSDAVAQLEFDPSFSEFPKREPLSDGRTLTWPIFSRLEPESDPEDWKDRRALLYAFKMVADKLADDAEKLGLLRPIG
ncbi:MAG TPA: hypothetical protein VNY51_14375 [Candidatus Dormibacteraeota bacterium]|jgi:hypothetical protein|nr:hypothetical protein [Candidatus Dormibacteraeota bacterium]